MLLRASRNLSISKMQYDKRHNAEVQHAWELCVVCSPRPPVHSLQERFELVLQSSSARWQLLCVVFIAAWCDKCLPVLHRCQVSGPSCSSVCNVRRSWCETRRCKGAARFCCAFQNFALQAFCLFVSTLIYMKNLYTALTEIYSLR